MDTNKKIKEIFTKLGISGDIGFDERDEDFWQRKLIEVYDYLLHSMKIKMETEIEEICQEFGL